MNLYPWIINQLLLLVIPLFISILPLKLDHRRSLGKLGTESTCLIKNLSVKNLMGKNHHLGKKSATTLSLGIGQWVYESYDQVRDS